MMEKRKKMESRMKLQEDLKRGGNMSWWTRTGDTGVATKDWTA